MKYLFLIVFSISCTQAGFAQNNQAWKGYFSYTDIKDVASSSARLYAASENALFSKNMATNEIKTTNTIDGLSSETISSIYHSNAFNKTLIGYETGLMIVINDSDGSILTVVDILNKQLPPNIKKINHFMEHEGIVYISCDFGIVQYKLSTLQFGDTYFIGDNGAEIVVSQTAVFENRIYAATTLYGIRYADIDNPNLNDFNQWTTYPGNGWAGIESFGDKLLAVSTVGEFLKWQGAFFTPITFFGEAPKDMRKDDGYLLITTPNHVFIYDENLLLVRNLANSEIPNITSKFTCASIINGTIYIGTNGNGVITTGISDSTFGNITPNGPVKNNIFAIAATTENLWAVYGDYDVDYNPFPLEYYGYSKYTPTGWTNTPYIDIKNAVGADVASLVRITANPSNENEVYMSSFHSGLLKIVDDVPTILYNQDNTDNGPEAPPGDTSIRIDGTAFDKSGNLWVTNSIVQKGLKVLKPGGSWQSYDLQGLYGNVTKLNIGRLSVDKNGTKWMPTRDDGIIAYNENSPVTGKKITTGLDTGNLPINTVKVATIDNRNQLWIGTTTGLRVLSSVDSFLGEGNMTTHAIILEEEIDGEQVAIELMAGQFITDIVVDGANNKWIGTADAGVFHVSPNGQEVLHKFNSTNSPLPSNSINDIDINKSTGEVFFATSKGLVSYKGTAIGAGDDLKNVLVYPNPVRPEYSGTVKITGLLDKANIKITDIEGNLVYEVISEGGAIEWDTTAFGKYRVASGVYMIFISSQDGLETKVKKVMIIR